MTHGNLKDPVLLTLFATGIILEVVGTTLAGHNLLADGAVVLATAVYFFKLADITKMVKEQIEIVKEYG